MMGFCCWCCRVEHHGFFIQFNSSLPSSPLLKNNKSIHQKRRHIVISNVKIAHLSATRKEKVKLPKINNYEQDGRGCVNSYSISEFLSHPSGIEAILNTNSMRSSQSLDFNTYRCTLPEIRLLNFNISPVLDLRVTPTTQDCVVEMLSCKFEGSQAVTSINERFSAFMKNHITWDANASEPCLYIDVKVEVSLEIFTQPFTSLPMSAVEKPGNLVVQTLVNRLVPLLLQQLLQDYEKWVQHQQQCHEESST